MLRFTNMPIPKAPPPQLDADTQFAMTMILNGMPIKPYEELVRRSPLTSKEWQQILEISEKQLTRIRQGKAKFTSYQTERILQVTEWYLCGMKSFDTKAKLRKWLKQPSAFLPKVKRLSLLNTAVGMKALEEELKML